MSEGAIISAHGRAVDGKETQIAAWSERARRDAMKHIANGLPDPRQFAIALATVRPELAAEIRAAEPLPRNAGFRVRPDAVKELRSYGLVECGEGRRSLTNFGEAVRRELSGRAS